MATIEIEDENYHGQLKWSTWKKIISHILHFKKQIAVLTLCGITAAGIEASMPLLTARLIDEASTNGLSSDFYQTALLYAALVLTICGCVYLFIIMAGQLSTGLAYNLRKKGFAHFQKLSFSYFDVRPVGWLVTRVTSDCTKISNLTPWFILDLVWGSLLILGMVGTMFWLHWPLALFVSCIAPLLLIVSVIFQQKMLKSSRQVRKTNSQLTADFNEGIAGALTTKSLAREDENLKEFQVDSQSMETSSIALAIQRSLYLPLVIVIGNLGVALTLWRGGGSLGDGITYGTLVAFMQYATQLYHPVQEIAHRISDLQNAQAAAERVQSLLDTEPKIQDRPEVLERAKNDPSTLPQSLQKLEFSHIGFSYKVNEPVIQNLNLEVKAGQTIALVGATGGGKSTIVNLLARFYEPTSGEILINGTDYRDYPLAWWQSQFGIVLQTPHLFSGSVAENIRYGRLDASDFEIRQAAKQVHADEFINRLPQGYDTTVGEGGAKLSTGQKQLIALARVILADPQIFIMDEATSSVDTETERLVQQAIEVALKDRFAFVIAHRLSTIQQADLILVIEEGKIVEQGTHKELLNRQKTYFELYESQYNHTVGQRHIEHAS